MEGVEVAIATGVGVSLGKLMGSEGVVVGARVCEAELPVRKVEDCSAIVGHRGITGASESCSQIKKTDAELYRNSHLLPREETEESSRGLDHGIVIGSPASLSGSDGKIIQRKVGKTQRNGGGPFKRLRMSQVDYLLPQAEADDVNMESDRLGSHLMKCSNADKSQASKQKNGINARRADRRNGKVPVKAKYDTFLLKAGLQSLSPSSGGSSAFGTHGLKPDLHDFTKLIDDISLDELLHGNYKCPNLGKDTGNKVVNGNESILDSVIKACSILRLQGLPQGKQTEENDMHVDKKIPSISSPSNRSAANSPDGDESSLASGLSKCSKDQDSCINPKSSADTHNNKHLYEPRDVLERLGLPPPRDLESLLQDAVKPATSVKVAADSRSVKLLPTRVSLPPFPCSHSFNGHHKSNNDAVKSSNRSSTCQGRWVRISSVASFTGAVGSESFTDLDSLTYDDSLVPPGKLKYRLPEIQRSSSSNVAQHSLPSAAPLPPQESESIREAKLKALHSPRVLAAAQTLCDMATHWLKLNSNGMLKWPKQPSLKSMKARKSRSSEKFEEELLTIKSETTQISHETRVNDPASSAKKLKLSASTSTSTSGVERTQDFSHVQAVIGLSSVSAPRSTRPSHIKLSRDSVSEARHSNNGSFTRPPFTAPQLPRVPDRTAHGSQKPRKVMGPMDWPRSRS